MTPRPGSPPQDRPLPAPDPKDEERRTVYPAEHETAAATPEDECDQECQRRPGPETADEKRLRDAGTPRATPQPPRRDR